MSAIEMLKDMGYEVEERKLPIAEITEAADKGIREEAFGTGTAAVISPIGELNYDGRVMPINNGQIGPVAQKLYDELTGIQWGKIEDKFGWTVEI